MDKALLPAGFHDLLFPEAGKKAHLLTQLFASVQKFGYELVDPPSIEFEKSLFTGAGRALKNQTFRLMDPISHKMMGVRCDITTQVARIAATRLQKDIKPMRLSYGGDVFRVKGEGLHAQRQLTQGGVELVGVDSARADAEVVLVMSRALTTLGIKNICIDFTMPRLIDIILDDLKYKKLEKAALINAVNKKNIAEIEDLAEKNAHLLIKLTGTAITPQSLAKMKLPKAAKLLISRLIDVVEIVEKSDENIQISIDPSESAKFTYHTGIGFTIFARGNKCEIGRGGRYEIEDDNKTIPATGATVYIDEILRLLPPPQEKERIFVPYGTPWKNIKKIAGENRVVICGVTEAKNNAKEAREQGCGLMLENDKVVGV